MKTNKKVMQINARLQPVNNIKTEHTTETMAAYSFHFLSLKDKLYVKKKLINRCNAISLGFNPISLSPNRWSVNISHPPEKTIKNNNNGTLTIVNDFAKTLNVSLTDKSLVTETKTITAIKILIQPR